MGHLLLDGGRNRSIDGGKCLIIKFNGHWFKCEADRFACIFTELVYSSPGIDKTLTGLGGGFSQTRMAEDQERSGFRLTTSASSAGAYVSIIQQKRAHLCPETLLGPTSSHPGGLSPVQWSGSLRSPLSLMLRSQTPIKAVVP